MNKDFFTNVGASLVASFLYALITFIICKDKITKHKELYADVQKIQRNYKDVFHKNSKDNFIVGIIEKQYKEIITIRDRMYKYNDMYPIFAWFFNYKKTIDMITLLADYTRNPIMLTKDKLFEDNYEIDLKKLFSKIKFYMCFQYKVLIMFVLLAIITFFVIKTFI